MHLGLFRSELGLFGMANSLVGDHSIRMGLLPVAGSNDNRRNSKGLKVLTRRLLGRWPGMVGWSFIDTRLRPGSLSPPLSG